MEAGSQPPEQLLLFLQWWSPTTTWTLVPERPRGEVELKHVDLSYPSWPDIQVFRDLSLRARAGKKLALVGEHELLLKVGDDIRVFFYKILS